MHEDCALANPQLPKPRRTRAKAAPVGAGRPDAGTVNGFAWNIPRVPTVPTIGARSGRLKPLLLLGCPYCPYCPNLIEGFRYW